MSAMLYTEESARAALVLGPVTAACNVCGKRHTFDLAAGESLRARRCRYQRAGRALAEVYQTYGTAFDAMGRYLGTIQRELETMATAIDSHEQTPLPFSLLLHQVRKLVSIVGLGCAGGRYTPSNIWTYQRGAMYYLRTFPSYADVCPWPGRSFWILLPEAQEVHRGIARIYLGWLCDEKIWDDVRAFMLEAGLTHRLKRSIEAKYHAARHRMSAVATSAFKPGGSVSCCQPTTPSPYG